jgi:hypothetical protein
MLNWSPLISTGDSPSAGVKWTRWYDTQATSTPGYLHFVLVATFGISWVGPYHDRWRSATSV